jgi:uncharacterized SAM-binding protein YcdF (DUF218 family)
MAVLLAAALLYRRSKRLSLILAAIAAALPFLFASPRVAAALQRLAESSARDTSRPDIQYDVALVLGGGDARIAAAGKLLREGRARYVLYSGVLDAPDEKHVRAMLHRAGVPDERMFLEERSRNTRENAVESQRVVAARGWRSVLLVTSASHVDRALGCFHDVGMYPDVVPVEWIADRIERQGWLPRRSVTAVTRGAVHELLGRLIYRALGYSA